MTISLAMLSGIIADLTLLRKSIPVSICAEDSGRTDKRKRGIVSGSFS
jgi:hypothetical protein